MTAFQEPRAPKHFLSSTSQPRIATRNPDVLQKKR